MESKISGVSVGWRLPLEIGDRDASEVRLVVMSFRGVPLKKMGKCGVSGVARSAREPP